MKFKIRKARYGDAKGIHSVRYAAWLCVYPNKKHRILASDIHLRFKKQLSEENLAKRNAEIRSPKPGFGLFVATHRNKIVGMCRVQKNKTTNKLLALYVTPGYQGKGVGSALWKKATTFMDKKNPVKLTAAIYNKRAIGFYEKLGFKDTGKRPVFKRGAMPNGAIIPIIEMRLSHP